MFFGLTEDSKIITQAGSIVKVTFVDMLQQRNTRKENEEIEKVKVSS